MANRQQDRKFIVSDPEKCNGCQICEYACSMTNEKTFNPHKSRIRITNLNPLNNMALSCRKCEDPLCVAACPKNAISQEQNTGIIHINEHACTGCGWCIGACSFGALNLHPDTKIAYTCNNCTNTNNKDEPQCIQWCPKNALQYVTTETLAQKARQKIVTQLLLETSNQTNNKDKNENK